MIMMSERKYLHCDYSICVLARKQTFGAHIFKRWEDFTVAAAANGNEPRRRFGCSFVQPLHLLPARARSPLVIISNGWIAGPEEARSLVISSAVRRKTFFSCGNLIENQIGAFCFARAKSESTM